MVFIIEAYSDMTLKKSDTKYEYINSDGKTICNIGYYIYDDIKNFDWINIADVDTNKKYQGQGHATRLLNTLIRDMKKKHPSMGLYLLVKVDNEPAIGLYKKTGFKVLKMQDSKKGKFYIMYQGNADIEQLKKQNFSV